MSLLFTSHVCPHLMSYFQKPATFGAPSRHICGFVMPTGSCLTRLQHLANFSESGVLAKLADYLKEYGCSSLSHYLNNLMSASVLNRVDNTAVANRKQSRLID